MRTRQVLIVVGFTLMVSACSKFYTMAPRNVLKAAGNLSIVNTGVVMATDKTIADHLISYETGKDCLTSRAEQGRTYCVEDEANPVADVYCYPTLGDVTCYETPNPGRLANEQVGSPR